MLQNTKSYTKMKQAKQDKSYVHFREFRDVSVSLFDWDLRQRSQMIFRLRLKLI